MKKSPALLAFALFFLSLCMTGVLQVFAAPVIATVKVEPMPFDAGSGVTLELVPVEGAPEVTFQYRWFINGQEIAQQTDKRLPGSLLKRGDELSVNVIPVALDGELLQAFVSLPLAVGNSSPEITSQPPRTPTRQGFNYRVVARDLDGDPLTFHLAQAPDGMTINAYSGQIDWSFAAMPKGVFSVVVVVEDGYDGQAEQTFNLNLSLIEKGSSR